MNNPNFAKLAGTLLALGTVSSQGALIELIGGSVRNGNLNDLTGATQFDPPSTTSAAESSPDGSRAANLNGAAGASVSIPFWSASRANVLTGGNSFFGFDDGTGTPLGGVGGSADRAFLYNKGEEAGAVDLIHDAFSSGQAFGAGSIFTLSFQLATDNSTSGVITTPQLSVAGSLLNPDSIILSATSGSASQNGVSVTVSGADSVTTATVTYTLGTSTLASDLIELTIDNALTVEDNAIDRAAIDNVSLSIDTIPEPSSALLAGLGILGLIRRRR